MKEIKYEVGMIVLGTAGRDKKKYLMIVGIVDENYVKIADGGARKVDRPKLKKIKHLRPTKYELDEFADKIKAGKPVSADKLKKALARLGKEVENV